MTAAKKKPAPKTAAKAKPKSKAAPKAKAKAPVRAKSVTKPKAKAPARAKAAVKPKAAAKPKAVPTPKPAAPAKAPAPAPVAPKAAAPQVPAALAAAVRALDDKKAEDIRVLRLGNLSSIADYYVMATGTSDPHLRALRVELDRVLSETSSPVRGIEAQRESGWVVVDAFDMIFHLFRPETRAAFRLEALWKDAEVIPAKAILAA